MQEFQNNWWRNLEEMISPALNELQKKSKINPWEAHFLENALKNLDNEPMSKDWPQACDHLQTEFRKIGALDIVEVLERAKIQRSYEVISHRFTKQIDTIQLANNLAKYGYINSVPRLELISNLVKHDDLDELELFKIYEDKLNSKIQEFMLVRNPDSPEVLTEKLGWQMVKAFYLASHAIRSLDSERAGGFFAHYKEALILAQQAGISRPGLDNLLIFIELPMELALSSEPDHVRVPSPTQVADLHCKDIKVAKSALKFLIEAIELYENEPRLLRMPDLNKNTIRMCEGVFDALKRASKTVNFTRQLESDIKQAGCRLWRVIMCHCKAQLSFQHLDNEDICKAVQWWIEGHWLFEELKKDSALDLENYNKVEAKYKKNILAAAEARQMDIPESVFHKPKPAA